MMQLFKKEIPSTARPAFAREVLPASTIRLIEALEAHNENHQLDGIIDLAHRQYWHDFDAEIEMPKIALAQMLVTFNQHELAQRVINGEFDSGSEEAQFWFGRNKETIERMIADVGGEDKLERIMREYFALSGRLDSTAMNRIFERIISHKAKRTKGRRWGKKRF